MMLFVPLLIGYGVVVLGLWAGLMLYFRLRSRMQPPGKELSR